MPPPAFWTARNRARMDARGFTLIEMLVSVVILVILMAIIFQIIQLTSSAYKQTTQGTGTMQQARVAFERMTRTISQATLNTYYSYFYASGALSIYMRQSELQFVSGYGPVAGTTNYITAGGQNAVQITHAIFFQAPLGVVSPSNTTTYGNLGNLLNACGYFVIYGPDTSRPSFLSNDTFSNTPSNEYRYRLMEYLQPSENLNIYTNGAVLTTGSSVPTWITNGLPSNLTTTASTSVHVLASNIVALIIMPETFASGTTTNGEANTTPVYTQPSMIKSNVNTTPSYNYDSAYYTPGGTPTYQRLQNNVTFVYSQFPTNNQLPPLVKVIMVAIDEASATRLAAKYPSSTYTSTNPPPLGNTNTNNTENSTGVLFTAPGTSSTDLTTLENTLTSLKMNYYVFQSDVVIRGAKWTEY